MNELQLPVGDVPVTIYAAVGEEPKPNLPTYATVADVLEKKTGSGWKLAGWTVARTALIIPPFLVVGVPWKQALAGGALASGMISLLTLARIGLASKREGVTPQLIAGTTMTGRGHYR